MEKVCDMLIERVHELEKEDTALRWVLGWGGAGNSAAACKQRAWGFLHWPPPTLPYCRTAR